MYVKELAVEKNYKNPYVDQAIEKMFEPADKSTYARELKVDPTYEVK